MRYLVTGGAGFVGSNLAHELEKLGHSVVVLDNFSTGHWENLSGFSGDVIAADVAEPAQWQDKIGDVDAIFHEAAITDTTVMDQNLMMRVNVEAFRALIAWAAARKVSSLVYASSAAVYGGNAVPMREADEPKPLNIYGFSKRVMESVASEASARHKGLRLVGLRYFNVYGARENFKGAAASMILQLARQMQAGKRPRIFEHGQQYRDFVYVKDVVEANLKALKAPKGVYNVCTGKKTSFNEIIELLNKTLGVNLKPEYFKNPYSFYQNETLGEPSLAAAQLKHRARFDTALGIQDYLGGRKTPVGV
jgi:ADP-L-glycero-D-manno-heptose 6-epimerase